MEVQEELSVITAREITTYVIVPRRRMMTASLVIARREMKLVDAVAVDVVVVVVVATLVVAVAAVVVVTPTRMDTPVVNGEHPRIQPRLLARLMARSIVLARFVVGIRKEEGTLLVLMRRLLGLLART